jgi:DNA (cytosine-5)-methyltransferase 1
MKTIKVGSDFSGVGAFNQALIRLGISYKEVFACDMDKYARQTFIHNYGEPEYYPTNVYEREIPKESLDIYMTSPPCQAFSLAGKRLGKDDKRGILFFNSHEFIKVNKPRYFIFENVKGLLSDDNGKTFQEWVNMLGGKSVNGVPVIFPYEDSVPYHLYWKVLNAKEHRVPQNRERVFIIGIRDDLDNKFRFPAEEHLKKRIKDILENDIDDKYFLSENKLKSMIKHSDKKKSEGCGFQFKPKFDYEIANCITTRAGNSIDDNYLKINNVNCKFNFYTCVNYNIMCDNCDDADNYEYNNKYKNNYKIRKLTPRECFRLMDFPDTFTWICSDSQAYKQAGNSIVVNVLYKILKNLNL